MADEKQEEPAPAASVGMMGKVVVGAVVGVFVLAESVVALMMLPDPDMIAAKVRNEIKNEIANKTDAPDDVKNKVNTDDHEEVELGKFNVNVHQAAANTTLTVSCKIMGTIDKADKTEFEALLENNKNRLSERIIIEFRSAEVNELTDAGLGLLKRRILEKTNILLGKAMIKAVIFPEYNYSMH